MGEIQNPSIYLYGHTALRAEENKNILLYTIKYIFETGLNFLTNSRIGYFEISPNEINLIIEGRNINKAHGLDNISVNMVKLCSEHLCVPLKIIFDNIL